MKKGSENKSSAFFVNAVKRIDWYADWSGPFCLLEVSTAPDIYFTKLQARFGKSFTCFLIIYHKGIASAWLPYKEFQEVGKYFADKSRNIAYVKKWAKDFKQAADEISPKMRLAPEEFLKKLPLLKKPYHDYGIYNVATKIVFNYLPRTVRIARDIFEDARKYSETFYKDNSEMFLQVADIIASKTGYLKHLILMMTRKELYTYQKTRLLPRKSELKQRYACSGMYFDRQGLRVLSKREVQDIENFWLEKSHSKNVLSGVVAYPGKVIGRCRIVSDYKKANLEEGEILVTGMTDPHFVPLMKKVAGIVTNGGGLLSHAAIVSRELKKPCVIGTKNATRVLKDGDLIEVDADKGIVKLLERSKK